MRILFIVILVITLFGCQGGGSTTPTTTIPRPLLSSLQSDFAEKPDTGTVQHPLVVKQCHLYPQVSWQTSLCSGEPVNTVWPQSNFYQTGNPPYWTVLANNESAIDLQCNTGAPGKSNKINEKMFFISHRGNDDVTLRVEHTNECPTIPYLSITNTGQISEPFGNDLTVEFDVVARMSGKSDHFNMYHFYVIFMNGGQRYIMVVYIGRDMGNGSMVEINWNWPFKGSIYYPSSNIRFSGTPVQNKILKDGNYEFTFNLDELIKSYYPELANSETTFVGVEFAVEQSYDYSQDGPKEPIFTELTINRLDIFKNE